IQRLTPRLTTVRQDTDAMGRAAAKQLIEIIEQPNTAGSDITYIPGSLIEGGTVASLST
ncbi:MAG: substrate-binding domain-containing protein, partial [Clostridia bacterium]|nr:substrate-binding domain-containing protein [Clostridia bacterium]